MLEIIEGDLFRLLKTPCVIAHGCNAQGKMNAGFAKRLRQAYPLNHLSYAKAYAEDGLNLGDVIFCNVGKLHIANLITQAHYGRDPKVVYADYAAVEKGLIRTRLYAKVNRLPIYLPFIGGGLANGDRNVLMEIFTRVFEKTNATLCVDQPLSRNAAWPPPPSLP